MKAVLVAGAIVLLVGLWPQPASTQARAEPAPAESGKAVLRNHGDVPAPGRPDPLALRVAAAEAIELATGPHGDHRRACGQVAGTEVCAHTLHHSPLQSGPVAGALAGPQPAPVCTAEGGSDFRVQPVLAHAGAVADDAKVDAIRQSLRNVDRTFLSSAARTGGSRQVRWVTDSPTPGCEVVIETARITTGASDFYALVDELIALGRIDPFGETSRTKYLVFTEGAIDPDAPNTCGLALYFDDDRPIDATPGNPNLGGGVSAVDPNCWDTNGIGSAPAHELMHTLGAVLGTAPNAANFGHCDDEADLMCYGPPGTMRTVCTGVDDDALFDCNNDDYFNTDPLRGQWLCGHWNTSDSPYLDGWNVIQPPRAVTFLEASANATTANVNWGATASCYGAASYQVTVSGRGTEQVDALSYSFRAPAGTYTVTVRPVGQDGALGTPRSTTVTLTDPTVPTAPPPPSAPPNRLPQGEMVLSLTDGRGYGMLGYAIDPETGGPARMRVTIPGVLSREYDWNYTWADMPRFTGLNNTQALVFLAQLPPGTHTVCLDALDPQGAGWTRLECSTHTVK